MPIYYPESLPLGLRNGRTYQLVSPLQRSELASGRAIQRRRFTSVPQGASVQWIFSDAQGQAFEAWWRDALKDGAAWFEMPLRTPMGLQHHTCRFTGVYSGPAFIGNGLWSYSAELELRFRAAPPVGEGLFPDDIVYSKLLDRTINIEWPTV